jgi:hypothetical protein
VLLSGALGPGTWYTGYKILVCQLFWPNKSVTLLSSLGNLNDTSTSSGRVALLAKASES